MESFNTVQELFSPIFTVLINCRIQFLFTFNVFPATVTIQGFALNFSVGTGVNTRPEVQAKVCPSCREKWRWSSQG